ncbi:uncharacterized protein TNCV_2549821 [Trichonephila clavipes]|nr:uncharacterized protein TNCV_2549821 [Trichonephila clavipes]
MASSEKEDKKCKILSEAENLKFGGTRNMALLVKETERCVLCSGTVSVRVQYFVRGGFVGYRSRASSKHLSPHLPVDGARFLGGQKGVALHLQDARVGVGSTKKPTPLDVDVRRSDVTERIGPYFLNK